MELFDSVAIYLWECICILDKNGLCGVCLVKNQSYSMCLSWRMWICIFSYRVPCLFLIPYRVQCLFFISYRVECNFVISYRVRHLNPKNCVFGTESIVQYQIVSYGVQHNFGISYRVQRNFGISYRVQRIFILIFHKKLKSLQILSKVRAKFLFLWRISAPKI